jgi:hypothetical protein
MACTKPLLSAMRSYSSMACALVSWVSHHTRESPDSAARTLHRLPQQDNRMGRGHRPGRPAASHLARPKPPHSRQCGFPLTLQRARAHEPPDHRHHRAAAQGAEGFGSVTGQDHQGLRPRAPVPAPGTEEQALEDLKALLQQRLAEAQRGELSSKSITQIGREAAE